MLKTFALFLGQLFILVSASQNGKYYECDPALIDTECIFRATSEAPFAKARPHFYKHNYSVSAITDYYKQRVGDTNGTPLEVTPKPWTNGDTFVFTFDKVTSDLWNYALVFDLVGPLRDVMMYDPSYVANDDAKWELLTKAFTDCGIKTEDVEGTHKAWGTTSVYGYLKNPQGNDIHHFILQYLEEGAIDLVCLVTSLDMDRCDTIREKMLISKGKSCNCFFDAYKAMYGIEPPIGDNKFQDCGPPDTHDTDSGAHSLKILNTLKTMSIIMSLGFFWV